MFWSRERSFHVSYHYVTKGNINGFGCVTMSVKARRPLVDQDTIDQWHKWIRDKNNAKTVLILSIYELDK